MLLFPPLLPYRLSYMGIKIPNDGLNIITLPFRKIEKINERINTNNLLDAYEYFELKDYDKAIQIYENYQKLTIHELIVR